MFKELYDILPPYGQILLTLVIVGVGAYAAWQGLKKAKSGGEPPSSNGPVPMWVMMGPVHVTMQTILTMAEEQRKLSAIEADQLRMLERIDRGQDYLLRLMEAILRNQEMRKDVPSEIQHLNKKGRL